MLNIDLFVPSYRKVGGDNERSFTVFCIEVFVNGRRTILEKRYTEFEELHKKLKKHMRTPEFPPKKVLKWNAKVLEHRRQGFENYLQGILNRDQRIPKVVLQFLNVSISDLGIGSQDSLDQLEKSSTVTHQPVLGFREDTYLQVHAGSLPDIVTSGAIQGLYGSSECISLS